MAKHHNPEVRAAVMAALLAGQGVSELAEQYKLPTSTISRWKGEATEGVTADVGDLLLGYLQENLKTLREQAIAFRDVGWLREQKASDLAILHGVMIDKCVRLLEVMEGGPVS